jgi:hypothetical protein
MDAMSDGRFALDADGRIWRIVRLVGRGSVARRPMTPRRAERLRDDGYLEVKFSWKGQSYCPKAHRLVFGNSAGYIIDNLDVNHKNGHRADNHPSNLEQTTRAGNGQHARYVLGSTRNGRLLPQEVRAIRQLHEEGVPTETIARHFGIHRWAVSQIWRGRHYAWLR